MHTSPNKTGWKAGISILGILLFSTVYLQAQGLKSVQFYAKADYRQHWYVNSHDVNNQYTNQDDKFYNGNFDALSNIDLLIGAQYKKWSFELGYAKRYFSSSIAFKGLPVVQFQDVTQTEVGHGITARVGYDIFSTTLGKKERPLTLRGKVGYTWVRGQNNFFSFGGNMAQYNPDNLNQLLYTYTVYDRAGIENSIHDNYHFIEGQLELEYGLLPWLGITASGGYTQGFKTVGRSYIELNDLSGQALQTGKTSTNGSSVNLGLGLKVKF